MIKVNNKQKYMSLSLDQNNLNREMINNFYGYNFGKIDLPNSFDFKKLHNKSNSK